MVIAWADLLIEEMHMVEVEMVVLKDFPRNRRLLFLDKCSKRLLNVLNALVAKGEMVVV